MLNQVILVARLEKITDEQIILKTAAPDTYESWYVSVDLPHSIMTNVRAYCHTGDVIGVKGHLEQSNRIVGEKITFLSSTYERGGEDDDSDTVQESTETESQS